MGKFCVALRKSTLLLVSFSSSASFNVWCAHGNNFAKPEHVASIAVSQRQNIHHVVGSISEIALDELKFFDYPC